ncbi:hypothetical protein [Xanthobacter sediminis]|uniref:hypothetical protein n=2 Tax=Xanthobacter sediminis TaxID=3119926 RepID=UPI00372ADC3A
MRDGSSGRVMRRHVFFSAGYHPMTVEDHFRVFKRELERFGAVWSIETRLLDAAPRPTPTGALWRIEAKGQGWQTHTTFEVLAWDDIARADMARSGWSHFKGQLRAIADMVASGTLARYFRASRRYGIFFILSYVALAVMWSTAGLAGAAAGLALAPVIGPLGAAVAGVALTAACGLILMRWPGEPLHLKQSLDLSEFSVDFAHGRHPEVDARVAAFARRIAEVAAPGAAEELDEVVVAGHSLGAMHAICALAGAAEADPAFGRAVPVRLLTLGSTTAKFALHPAGQRLREAAARVAATPAIGWLEIQSRDDIVSFYKVNPVTLGPAEIVDGKLRRGDYALRPLVRHVAIRDMITPATYNRFRFDMMRLHCQCFLAGDKRAHHDFHAYVCGPVPFDALAATPGGLLPFLDETGRLAPPASGADAQAPSND